MSVAVVFGGAGFLGSHVTDKLTEHGHTVRVFDVRPSSYLKPNQEMIVGDILDLEAVQRAVAEADYVYNFAGVADIEAAAREPLKTIRYNILGTTHILEACRMHVVRRFVFASSVYVYSHLGSFYRSSKQACEKIIQNYQEEFGLDFTILRYGSLYGPRANYFNAIQNYVEQAVLEGRIVRYGEGLELREYIHVLDAAEGSVQILRDEYANQFVMLTGSQAMRVRDVLLMIREMMHNEIEVEFIPSETKDIIEQYHYHITPFSFRPEKARKLVLGIYHDLGQGLLELLYQAYERYENERVPERISLRTRPSDDPVSFRAENVADER